MSDIQFLGLSNRQPIARSLVVAGHRARRARGTCSLPRISVAERCLLNLTLNAVAAAERCRWRCETGSGAGLQRPDLT
jgi:hypothetical protein